MAYGLQVWNSAGVLVLSITDRLVRYHTTITGTVPTNGTINVSVPGYALDGSWFAFPRVALLYVKIDDSANTITLTNYTSAKNFTIDIFRG